MYLLDWLITHNCSSPFTGHYVPATSAEKKVYIAFLEAQRMKDLQTENSWYCTPWSIHLSQFNLWKFLMYITYYEVIRGLMTRWIDLMHMTSQKGAPLRVGGTRVMRHCHVRHRQACSQWANPCMPYRRAGPGPRTDWEPTLFQHNTCAQRDKSWPPTWRRCYGDVTSMHKVYKTQDPVALHLFLKWSL